MKTKLRQSELNENTFDVTIGEILYRISSNDKSNKWLVRRSHTPIDLFPFFEEVKTNKGWMRWEEVDKNNATLLKYEKHCDEMFK